MLKVTDICSSYGEAKVLDRISMHVSEGEIVALLGRNGMGKTSLVRSIMGLGTPRVTSGSVQLNHEELTGQRSFEIANKGIGYVPQGRRLFQSLTVLEHLQMLARKDPDAWTVRRVFDAFPRLEERKHHRGNQLSGGERGMLAIGRALMGDPALLLLDEPMEGLAPIIVEMLMQALQRLIREEALTVILVEQSAKLALQVTQQVLVLSRGRIIHSGASAALLADPDHLAQLVVAH